MVRSLRWAVLLGAAERPADRVSLAHAALARPRWRPGAWRTGVVCVVADTRPHPAFVVRAGKQLQALEVQPLGHVIPHRELDDQLWVDPAAGAGAPACRASRSAAGRRGHRCAGAVRSFLRPVPARRRGDGAGSGDHQQRPQGESPEDDQRNAAEHYGGQRLPARAAQVPARPAGGAGRWFRCDSRLLTRAVAEFGSPLTTGGRGASAPPHGPPGCRDRAMGQPGLVSGVASGRHPVAADQPGAGQGSACSWWPTLPSAAFLAAVEDPASPG
jgi:hypothetical protein